MNWMNALEDVVQRYSGQSGGTSTAPADPHQDFQRVANSAPKDVVAQGLSQAMQSDQTPPFPEMISKLFTHSDANQQAGLLNKLLSAVGPGALGGLFSGGQVTPQQASQVSPRQVQDLAAHAQQRNPSVVEEVSSSMGMRTST